MSLYKVQLDSDSGIPIYKQLVRGIEKLIHTGRLKEGDRLPSTSELIQLWGLSTGQIQRAMDSLVLNGLLQRFPKRGTFVAPQSMRPSIGVLCNQDLLQESAQFGRVLASALRNEIQKLGFTCRIYDAFRKAKSNGVYRPHKELAYDLRHHSFSGFVFLNGITVEKIPELKGTKLPYVTFGYPKSQIDVNIDYHDFAFMATRWLIENDCQKLAYIYMTKVVATDYTGHIRGFLEAIDLAGLQVPTYAMVDHTQLDPPTAVDFTAPDRTAYEGMVRILKQWRARKFMPDGILISDDIVARGVAVAIQSEIQPKELPKIAVLATEGAEQFYALPAARYVVSTTTIANKLMHRLMEKITGEDHSQQADQIKGKMLHRFR